MKTIASLQQQLAEDGYTIMENVFSTEQAGLLKKLISDTHQQKDNSGAGNEIFAVRRFLKVIPEAASIIFNPGFIALFRQITGSGYFVVKSIYFDKPPHSNWFVSFHQDLTISVDKKFELAGFGPWTVKQDQFAVQPPLPILEDNITVRIHLDDTNADNGALNIIPGSHRNGIIRPETADLSTSVSCPVPKGGIMLMKPLLLHASGRTTNHERRRVIHIEFSRQALPESLQWAEYFDFVKQA